MAATIVVNGKAYHLTLAPDTPLLWILRDELQLSGTKYGCGEGQCGACSVLLEGKAVRSCITPFSAAVGRRIITIEGLEQNGKLHSVQEAFLQEEAFQCAYCTSGMILAAVALLSSNKNPSDAEIIHGMNGNICRCGTYPRIVAAVKEAAKAERKA